jgi:hypothetical protein
MLKHCTPLPTLHYVEYVEARGPERIDWGFLTTREENSEGFCSYIHRYLLADSQGLSRSRLGSKRLETVVSSRDTKTRLDRLEVSND